MGVFRGTLAPGLPLEVKKNGTKKIVPIFNVKILVTLKFEHF